MTGPSGFTEDEIEKIQQLRSRVAGELTTKFQNENAYLITWLRARSMNVDLAEDMLRKSLTWRKENRVDGIVDREVLPEKLKNRIPFAHLGTDPESGCPVFLFLMGRYDFRSIIEEDGAEGALRLNILFMEIVQGILKECSKKAGRPVTSFIELADLEGYSFRQIATKECRETGIQMQQIFDLNYPEVMKSVMMVNAPKIFALVYNIMKPFVSKATLEKIEIFGPDVEKWQAAVGKKFPMQLVPRHWGGTLDGNDEYCSDSDIWLHGALGPKFFSDGKERGLIMSISLSAFFSWPNSF